MTQFEGRSSDFPVDPMFVKRWSPRAFTGEAMDEATLMSLFEAARWAPSSYNGQPWRFVYGHHGSPAFATLLGLLGEGNRGWAAKASVLMVALSKLRFTPRGEEIDNHAHAFDVGAAWMSLTLQANKLGWHTHAMVGLDMARALVELGVPAGYRVEAAIAVGKIGDKAELPEMLREREQPNSRQPVKLFAFEVGSVLF